MINNFDVIKHAHQGEEIKDNALKALVTSPLFKAKIEQVKKVRGVLNVKRNIKTKSLIL
ncbi:alternative ribosome rescue factor ArfA [Pseudoalteromonas sp. MMG005]|uniref:alternative ribosome rescue factor ArfA n=1 Tax=Pseudoalteromonas sp. MMG005 TaxID=2822682 RepID=UPI0032B4F1CF